MIKRLLILAVLIFIYLPAIYIGLIYLFRAFPPPPELEKYVPLMSACMSFVGAVTTAIIIDALKATPRNGLEQAKIELEGKADPEYVQNKSRFKEIAAKLWERKELYKRAGKREAIAAMRYRQRLYVWRAAMVFAVYQMLSGILASALIAIRFPHGTTGEIVPWWLDHMHAMLLAVGAFIIPAAVYDRYMHRPRAIATPMTAVLIGWGGIFLGSAVFFLGLTPEGISFLNQAGPESMSPLPVKVLPATIHVPFFIYIFVQKIIVLPLLGLLGVLVLRGIRRRDPVVLIPMTNDPHFAMISKLATN